MQPIFSRLLNLETRIGMMIDRTDYLQKIIKKELIRLRSNRSSGRSTTSSPAERGKRRRPDPADAS